MGLARDPIIVVGGGIGGLTTALALHRRGLRCRVYEQSPSIRELGVGINTLPHAIGELETLGLLDRLDAVAVRTYELIYMNRFGQEIWRELRGLDAGHPVPQFSIHRGVLQGVLRDAVVERLGAEVICTGRRLAGFEQDERRRDGALRRSRRRAPPSRCAATRSSAPTASTRPCARRCWPARPPPRWNGTMLWRGATDWPVLPHRPLDDHRRRHEAKVVLYPIGAGSDGRAPAHQLGGHGQDRRGGDAAAPARGLVPARAPGRGDAPRARASASTRSTCRR